MKTCDLRKMLVVAAVAGLALPMFSVLAQGAVTTIEPATAGASGTELPAEAAKVLKLVQAKVADSTIIAYINNSGNHYRLHYSEILYLRKNGVSNAVITAMLNQPAASSTIMPAVTTATPAPAPVPATQSTPVPTVVNPPAPVYVPPSEPAIPPAPAVAAPPVTYVPEAPSTTYYYPPSYDYQPYDDSNYYAAYPWYPPVSLSLGWGWGGRWGGWGGGWRGDWHGGDRWHGDAGWHGGGGWHGWRHH